MRLKIVLPAFLLALLTCGILFAAKAERVYQQSGSHLRISIETYQARRSLTPVIVSLAGAEVEAEMDRQGRVFAEVGAVLGGSVEPLFTIDLEQGWVDLGGGAQPIFIYEQNDVRTRFWFAADTVELPLELDRDRKSGTLYLGRLEIPVKMAVDENVRLDSEVRRVMTAPRSERVADPSAVAHLRPDRIRIRTDKGE
jgi:hypothetical protein